MVVIQVILGVMGKMKRKPIVLRKKIYESTLEVYKNMKPCNYEKFESNGVKENTWMVMILLW